MSVSVIIPAYNAKDTIKNILDAFSRQTKAPYEIIVVDSDSSDGTSGIVNEFIKGNTSLNISLLEEAKRGPSPARNKGATTAKGDILAFIDADEIPSADWIQLIEDEFSGGSQVVWGPVTESKTDTFLKKYLDFMGCSNIGKRELLKPDTFGKSILAGNFAIKKDLFIHLGGFDEKLHLAEDVDLSRRISKEGVTIVYSPALTAAHDHKETFRGRFSKAFGYGSMQARCLKEYSKPGCAIVLLPWKAMGFRCPVRINIKPFSILWPLVIALLVSLFSKAAASFLVLLLFIGIAVKVAILLAKSGRKANVVLYVLYILYWTMERITVDLGRVFGSFKYRVICL